MVRGDISIGTNHSKANSQKLLFRCERTNNEAEATSLCKFFFSLPKDIDSYQGVIFYYSIYFTYVFSFLFASIPQQQQQQLQRIYFFLETFSKYFCDVLFVWKV